MPDEKLIVINPNDPRSLNEVMESYLGMEFMQFLTDCQYEIDMEKEDFQAELNSYAFDMEILESGLEEIQRLSESALNNKNLKNSDLRYCLTNILELAKDR